MFKLNNRASGVMEYALVLGVVSMALSSMFIYLKRGVQARAMELTNELVVKELFSRGLGEHQFQAGQGRAETETETTSSVKDSAQADVISVTVNETTISNTKDFSVPEGWEEVLPE